MSADDVYPGEMDAPDEFDDEAAEAMLSDAGRGIDPQLADLFDDMRVAYTSQPPAVGAELSAVLAEAELTPAASPARRFERMRSSIVAKAGAAAAVVVAATGGLAVAHALPESMQDAASQIGIGAAADQDHHAHEAIAVESEDSTTTSVENATTVPGGDRDAVEPGDDNNDQGAVVGSQQGDDQNENKCEADDQDEHSGAVTTTTVPCVPTTETTETTVPESHDGNQSDNHDTEPATVSTVPETHDEPMPGSTGSGSDDEQRTTTPTTTSHSDGGDGSSSGSSDGGSSHGG